MTTQALLDACRAKLAELWDVEAAAALGPWRVDSSPRWKDANDLQCDGILSANDVRVVETDGGFYEPTIETATLIATARNLFPAMLDVAEKMLASAAGWMDGDSDYADAEYSAGDDEAWHWQLTLAARLLGVSAE